MILLLLLYYYKKYLLLLYLLLFLIINLYAIILNSQIYDTPIMPISCFIYYSTLILVKTMVP